MTRSNEWCDWEAVCIHHAFTVRYIRYGPYPLLLQGGTNTAGNLSPRTLEHIGYLSPVVNTTQYCTSKEHGWFPQIWIQILPQTLTIRSFSITFFFLILQLFTCEGWDQRTCKRHQTYVCFSAIYCSYSLSVLALGRFVSSSAMCVCCPTREPFDLWTSCLIISWCFALFFVAILGY